MTPRQKLGLALVMVGCGAIGMALFQGSWMLYQDWHFLHVARVLSESPRQSQAPQARPVPPPSAKETP